MNLETKNDGLPRIPPRRSFRLALGLLTDQIGARRTGLLGLTLTSLPLLLGWLWADSFDKIILVGLLLGVAGASFAAALPLASRWYPPQYQGLAMRRVPDLRDGRRLRWRGRPGLCRPGVARYLDRQE